MTYRYVEGHYCAGALSDGVVNHFVEMQIDGIPVEQLGFSSFGIAGNIYDEDILRLYTPGSIKKICGGYVGCAIKNLEVFYCGETRDVAYICNYQQFHHYKIYGPAERAEDFQALWTIEDQSVYKANVSYRLNADELPEYYYVDWVEYGEVIENVPPEPTMYGYEFGGWYTESDCINQWNFANAVPQPNEGEDFKELCLYAAWIKK